MKIRCNIVLLIMILAMAGCAENEQNMTIEVLGTEFSTEDVKEKQESENVPTEEIRTEEQIADPQTMNSQATEFGMGEQQTTEEAITMLTLLRKALLPVGSTMYIWGGGWNEEDTGAGVGATTIGVLPEWAEFASGQTADYNMKEHRYEIRNGLDCSGYMGWLVYNVFETENGRSGYVYKSTDTARAYSELGWGDYIEAPQEFLTGDIVSMKGHVWLAVGTCEDSSVVLLHASPPGVSLCGTALADGSESEAVRLAREYMKMYAPQWQQKYPDRSVSSSYLNAVGLLRWSEDMLPGAEEYRRMPVEDVLQEMWESWNGD